MFMVKTKITEKESIYGKGQAEILQINVKGNGESKRDLPVSYVPCSETGAWNTLEVGI